MYLTAYQQNNLVFQPQRERLGYLRGLDAVGFCGLRDGCRTSGFLQNLKVGACSAKNVWADCKLISLFFLCRWASEYLVLSHPRLIRCQSIRQRLPDHRCQPASLAGAPL